MQQSSLATRTPSSDYLRLVGIEHEKRIKPRQNIYLLVKYRTSRMTSYADGILCNLSQDGALFYALGDLELSQDVQVMIIPDQSPDLPIQLTAEVVRREANNSTYNSFNYGCRIRQIEDPNARLSGAVRSNLFGIMAQQRCA
jgi:hypothetical protein